MDYLKLADSLIRDITGSMQPEEAVMQANVSQAAALIALVEEQRKTNELLHRLVNLGVTAFGRSDVLDCFTQHPRPNLECVEGGE